MLSAINGEINAINTALEFRVGNYNIINANTPKSSPAASMSWMLTHGYSAWFERGNIVSFTDKPSEGFCTMLIGGTDADFFSALRIDFYAFPNLVYYLYSNGTWTTKVITAV